MLKRFGLLSFVCAVLFALSGIATAQKLPRITPRKTQHEKSDHMSAMGHLAARVNSVLRQRGIVTGRALAAPPNPTGDKGCTNAPQGFGDPDVKYLGACTFVYSSILVAKYSATAAVQTMGIHRSTDCGHTWTGPFEITAATNPNGFVDVNGNPVDAADKEFIDVDRATGRLMVSWTNFTPVAVGGIEMSTTYSDNALSGNPLTWSPRQVVSATEPDGQSSVPRFAGNGTNAYVVLRRFPSFYGNTIAFA